MDRLLHGRIPVRHDDRLAAIATRFNHAAFVVVAGLVADCVAEVEIDPPDSVAEPIQRRMHNSFHLIGRLPLPRTLPSVLSSSSIVDSVFT